METTTAIDALSALAHSGRLEVFRLLVRTGPEGLAAGEIARAVATPASTLSTNLSILAAAGLVTSRRDGRQVIYAADYPGMGALMAFLLEDCCCGRSEICTPLAEVVSRCAVDACGC